MAAPFLTYLLGRRANTGKEDKKRLLERHGIPSLPRPAGPLIWFHAASVGETMSLLPLLQAIRVQYPKSHCLVTTGTVTAAKIAAERLPEGCFHQYAPLDAPQWVDRFLNHWNPSMAVFVESEIWPSQLTACRDRGIPLYLVNARLSETSFKRWSRFPKTIKALLNCCTHIMAQSPEIAERLAKLGATHVTITGNLKFAAAPLGFEAVEAEQLSSQIGSRHFWVAASTHAGEEEIVLDAHLSLVKGHPNALTILVPRHPSRAEDVVAMIQSRGLKVVRRSSREPLAPEVDIYLVDTLGELGLFYGLSPIALLGGTLIPIGGHNPIEAVLYGCALIWGPYRHKSADICDLLQPAAFEVTGPESLAKVVSQLFQDSPLIEQHATLAQGILSNQRGVVERIMEIMDPTIRDIQKPHAA